MVDVTSSQTSERTAAHGILSHETTKTAASRSDIGTVVIHWTTAIATMVCIATGLRIAADALNATMTLMTADGTDVEELVGRTAKAPVAVAAAGEGTRWAEAGWWLVPFIAALVLLAFRREEQPAMEGAA